MKASIQKQAEHLIKAKKTVEGFNLDAEIVLLWVDGDWATVEKL